jgi:hypothetical protein
MATSEAPKHIEALVLYVTRFQSAVRPHDISPDLWRRTDSRNTARLLDVSLDRRCW